MASLLTPCEHSRALRALRASKKQEGEKCTALTPLQIEDLYEYVSTSHLFVPFGAPSALRARERRALTFLLVLTPSPKGTGLVKKHEVLARQQFR